MKINYKELRENFFREHTEKSPYGIPKVTTHPHNLFEWFKAEINEYLKD